MSSINYDLKKIKGIAFDVDGVLSPSTIPLSPDGEPLRMVSIKDGYDTIISENDGLPLSLKQTIAIARTILKGSKIMLFDDALLGLDDNEQDKVLNLLLKLKKDHTIVMISHDKNVLKDAEKIIVMDAKQVAESGTLSELIEKKGTYYNLFEKSSVSSKEE